MINGYQHLASALGVFAASHIRPYEKNNIWQSEPDETTA
jgi:hypothetical protein